ncbi:MAG: uroporphyrinogen-III C-methyltransferase [Candidatus Bathyarchaeia archaeon]
MGDGKVYIVGAGPGDPELLTIKAERVLRKADVLLYDRLVTEGTLGLVPESCERIYVGKHPGEPSTPQERINEMMIEKAGEGMNVVRLKGGDPFLFGRGGEEAGALRRAGVSFEVVPGITSAIAVPAYAGIPVTHRQYASSVAIVTGHEARAKKEGKVNWEKLASSVDTIVIMMGIRNLGTIMKRLIAGGRDPDTPVAIIEKGTTAEQRITRGALRDIAQRAESVGVAPPAVTVIGNVVELQEELYWLDE